MKTLPKIILIALAVAFAVFLLWASEVRSQKVMAIDYCFQELADGSLYHYVCEK